ncbi:bifunctional 2-C-methyl-D-erythritol 4-phosphate cytidylyltransferase/2-C-methyl-D-erythritol 2,4-cyclodiphosphate synthase [Roseibaca sp. Y0-43]|uniref:bifunctional 2-C-methyl-D-erythritol 4-phosphate cytidylyltransferase/2-C-methyl-D-erythritol 2,4-cyclodiphosphate synthase n=1 Tax=Roseibaca sp. Y0-43 TaxID=2816854 RepID=UPI001D0C4457|nr:bifunctional 2-C-methyl-D-erythritol 4-phosphate cytidylyltransferase/2-C-methyl-D-erythritol 2,4-cyclodiphosphate synthase [Roseibaca sp. Y0-43]MCC1482208.1 bifunctional 2-C-methyl-D-erythritol 4-phosphate cytidylyltransferase/2-C-methyl-D-erythritol 2,4-cyclodiphosphate synthase [Roseibaca sp. Y0-43]
MTESTAAIIVAAGRGTRAGEGLPKQWRPLTGRPVLAWTLDALRAGGLSRLVLVLHPDDMDRATTLDLHGVTLVAGGATRTASVRAALDALADDPPARVLIHDGARPFVSARIIADVQKALNDGPAAAPALAVVDALWRGDAGLVGDAVARDGLYRAQTPQGFHFAPLHAAHKAWPGDAPDDVEIARAYGLPVALVPGSDANFKLTYPPDFDRAEAILQARTPQMTDIRLGNGYDVHRFGPGDGCWLCGIKVPHGRGLQGHSDADVGMHALTDAIYGALAEGDIGRHFPPSDPQWKGAESHIFLRHAIELARARGYQLGNCDVTLVCEHPKIGPHATAMQAELARIMGVEPGRVSVKATTSERLGFTGREEGIAALATACLIAG